jgi:hypothetical protein
MCWLIQHPRPASSFCSQSHISSCNVRRYFCCLLSASKPLEEWMFMLAVVPSFFLSCCDVVGLL